MIGKKIDEVFGFTEDILSKEEEVRTTVDKHDWDMNRESIFSVDHFRFRCRRCLKFLTVKRDQTMDQALAEMGVDENCGMVVLNEVMNE